MYPVIKKTFLGTSVMGVLLSLTGCGGSTTGSAIIPTPKTINGTFVDAPVDNLIYSTPSSTTTKLTQGGGKFECTVGETVTFKVGGVTLGKAPCQRIVTPQTLAAVDQAGGDTTNLQTVPATDPKVVNRVRLLMTLDMDGNPNNGIQLPPETEQKNIPETNIDFENTQNFDNEASTQVLAKLPSAHNSSLKNTAEAKTHFQSSLNSLKTQYSNYYDENTGEFNESKYKYDHAQTNTTGSGGHRGDDGNESHEGHEGYDRD